MRTLLLLMQVLIVGSYALCDVVSVCVVKKKNNAESECAELSNTNNFKWLDHLSIASIKCTNIYNKHDCSVQIYA